MSRTRSRQTNLYVKYALIVLAIYALGCVVLAMFWSNEPDTFDVVERAQMRLEERGELQGKPVVGYVTANTLIEVVDAMMGKSGGYISNDRFPPGIVLDNIPAWEFGVLVQVRDMARAMRKDISRSQSQSAEDPDIAEAEPRLHFDNNSWVLPSTEGEYKDGIKYFTGYLHRLADAQSPDAQFYARADNLRTWLADMETRLGSLSQKLSASVGRETFNIDLAGDSSAQMSTPKDDQLVVKTPWLEIDDVFYEARGSAWALLHFLKAIEVDFYQVLEKKNAVVSLRQIIRELEATQETLWSPVVLNGGGFGMLANHSLVMANYISRANAAIIDLRELLSRG